MALEQSRPETIETPIERAAREEEADPAADTARAEHEADVLIADIDSYVARTDPASLPEAEAQLNAWEIPEDTAVWPPAPTLDLSHLSSEGHSFVPIFAAGSESEAEIVRGMLEGEGIPAMTDSVPAAMTGYGFIPGETRSGNVLVPADLADEARAMIAASGGTPIPEGEAGEGRGL